MGNQPVESVAAVVGRLLKQRGLKLALAESCTGGLVSDLVTDVPGSSDYFVGGITAYSYEAKESLLGVKHETLTIYGAVSPETVLEMARGVRHIFTPHIKPEQVVGVSISGIAGPGGGTPDKPIGLVWIGLSAPDFEQAFEYHWQGNRRQNKQQSARKALELLLQYLQRD